MKHKPRGPRKGMLKPVGGAHWWRDNGVSLWSMCGLGRTRRDVDFKAEFMWPTCNRCMKSKARQEAIAMGVTRRKYE